MNELWESIRENVTFLLIFLLLIVAVVLVAYLFEKHMRRKNGATGRILTTWKIAMIGVFSAIATILHFFEIPVPFAPSFYELDFSELPVLIGAFAFGPVAGVLMEFCKILLKIVFMGTTTAFVGDLANFVIGCSLILPASMIYQIKKTKKGAMIGLVTGSLCMIIFATIFNAVYLLPTFSKLFGIPLDSLIAMGTKINPAITNVTTFACFAVAPFNLLKSGLLSIITLLIYKPLHPILKYNEK